jgi:hypothetical protein
MMKPTPLVILARLLAERRGEEPPTFGEREAEEVRDALRRLAQRRWSSESRPFHGLNGSGAS